MLFLSFCRVLRYSFCTVANGCSFCIELTYVLCGLSDELSMTCCRKLDLALEVARILERLHRFGVVHGDLKVANILVADDGSLHFCDFADAICLDDPPDASPDEIVEWYVLVVGVCPVFLPLISPQTSVL
eukprot:jgi/Botrbrau1/3988/Bobra.0016s0001.1